MTLKDQIQGKPIRHVADLLAERLDALSQAPAAESTMDDEIDLVDLEQVAAEWDTTPQTLVSRLNKHQIPIIKIKQKRFVRKPEWRRALIECFNS